MRVRQWPIFGTSERSVTPASAAPAIGAPRSPQNFARSR